MHREGTAERVVDRWTKAGYIGEGESLQVKPLETREHASRRLHMSWKSGR
jgi:hypothetical protein